MVLRTAGDDDDVEVEEYEDFDLQVKANSGEESVVRNNHRLVQQETAFRP